MGCYWLIFGSEVVSVGLGFVELLFCWEVEFKEYLVVMDCVWLVKRLEGFKVVVFVDVREMVLFVVFVSFVEVMLGIMVCDFVFVIFLEMLFFSDVNGNVDFDGVEDEILIVILDELEILVDIVNCFVGEVLGMLVVGDFVCVGELL